MNAQSQVETIVKNAFPDSRIVQTLEGTPARGGDMKRVQKAPALDVMQRKLQGGTKTVTYAKAAVGKATRKGPSGIVFVAPKNADGPASRRKAKAVVVSRGKVIALQG